MNDTVECPYCEFENDMSDGCTDLPNDNKFDSECEKCGREFEVEVEFYPSYGARKIVYDACERCGERTRNAVKRGRRYPYPKAFSEDVICETCWRSGMLDEHNQDTHSDQ